jgi:hypothetical protein
MSSELVGLELERAGTQRPVTRQRFTSTFVQARILTGSSETLLVTKGGSMDIMSQRSIRNYMFAIGMIAKNVAISRTIDLFIPSVARRTGRLREAVRRAIENSIQVTGDDVIIQFLPTDVTRLAEYGIYHMVGFGSTGHAYKNPTTPGTRPINPLEIENILRDAFESTIADLIQIKIR